MSQPLVSIVIPTKNSAKTLPLCLTSIKRQTYRNIEVIVVDGCSANRTIQNSKQIFLLTKIIASCARN